MRTHHGARAHVGHEAIVDAYVPAGRAEGAERVAHKVIVEQDEDLLAGEEVEVAPELPGVEADPDIVPVPAPAVSDPRRLGLDRCGEVERFKADLPVHLPVHDVMRV